MRKSNILILFLSTSSLLVLLTAVDASIRQKNAEVVLQKRTQLVKDFKLTDLALFTEARYTRHLTQADLHTAFQDHPMAMEHFPSGSFYLPPPSIRQGFSQ